MNTERPTKPTSDAAKPADPAKPGGVVIDFDTYVRWLQGDATAVDVVENAVGFE
jgi:hypothetical protein